MSKTVGMLTREEAMLFLATVAADEQEDVDDRLYAAQVYAEMCGAKQCSEVIRDYLRPAVVSGS